MVIAVAETVMLFQVNPYTKLCLEFACYYLKCLLFNIVFFF